MTCIDYIYMLCYSVRKLYRESTTINILNYVI